MALIESNLKGVIRRLEFLRDNLHVAVARALALERWETPLKNQAGIVLAGLARTPAEQAAADAFLKTITVAMFGTAHLRATMSAPAGTIGGGQGANFLATVVDNAPRPKTFVSENVRIVRPPMPLTPADQVRQDFAWDAIAEWCREYKDLAVGETIEEATENIRWILFGAPATEAILEARRSLIFGRTHTHKMNLGEFLALKLEQDARALDGISAATAHEWLRAVLAHWSGKVHAWLPTMVRQEIRKLRGQSQQEMFS